MKITITREYLECFQQSWPCHGIPQAVDSLIVCFDTDGDLVDYEAYDSADSLIDLSNHDVDGRALSALFEDAKEHRSKLANPQLVRELELFNYAYGGVSLQLATIKA